MRADEGDRKNDLFLSIEDGLSPILAVCVATLLGVAVLHFDRNIEKIPTATINHSRSHIARG